MEKDSVNRCRCWFGAPPAAYPKDKKMGVPGTGLSAWHPLRLWLYPLSSLSTVPVTLHQLFQGMIPGRKGQEL